MKNFINCFVMDIFISQKNHIVSLSNNNCMFYRFEVDTIDGTNTLEKSDKVYSNDEENRKSNPLIPYERY